MGSPQFSLAEGVWLGGTPYRVVRPLGLGGMGEVYEVDHTRTGTRRAIKVLRDSSEPSGTAARRLVREGRALAVIDHPNVVRVFEVGVIPDGRPYFAMQLLEGMTFRALLSRSEPIGVETALRLVLQALSGLQAVHDNCIVHRDLKPTNLFLCRDGCVKVLDFGVAKLMDASMSSMSTAAGLVLGTMRYMAPEQLSGMPVTAATDVYAMGLVLFELIARQHAFASTKEGSGKALARLKQEAPRLSSVTRERLPDGLDDVLQCALRRDPARRFADAGEFAQELRTCLDWELADPAPTAAAPRVSVRWDDRVEDETTVVRQASKLPSVPEDGHALLWRVGLASSIGALVLASLAAAMSIAAAIARPGAGEWPGGSHAQRGTLVAPP